MHVHVHVHVHVPLHAPCICKVRWDLIYLGGSAQYCKVVEPAVDAPGSCLRVAGHRKARTTCTCSRRPESFTRMHMHMHRAAALALDVH